jgi:prevent-host-death family protein
VGNASASTQSYAASGVYCRMYILMYTSGMSKQYSIADARRNLPTVVDEVESGSEVQLTRRGRAVAVVVSIEEYERLKANRMTFAEAYDAFRKKFPAGRDGISSRYFRSVRERGRGREVDL